MNTILDDLSPYLSATDDPSLWRAVLEIACADISAEVAKADSTRDVFLIVGPCSAWLRPHQSRWRVGNEEFAWPPGYGGFGYSRLGLPELDWCCCFRISPDDGYMLVEAPRQSKHRPILLRLAIPTLTIRRRKSSIHMLWTPGTPDNPRHSMVRFLAMSRDKLNWNLAGSILDSGERWRGEVLPPPDRRIYPPSSGVALLQN